MGVRRYESRRCIVAGSGTVAEAVVQRLRSEGGAVAALAHDPSALVTDAGASAAVAAAVAGLGGLDVCVTAFVHRCDAPFLEIDDAEWVRCIDENLTCAFTVAREAAREMLARAGGTIVHVGSDVAARPGSGSAAYAAAKAGLQLMSTGMALDLSLGECVSAPWPPRRTARRRRTGRDSVPRIRLRPSRSVPPAMRATCSARRSSSTGRSRCEADRCR